MPPVLAQQEALRVPPFMAPFRQEFQPGLLSDLESSKATLQCQRGEVPEKLGNQTPNQLCPHSALCRDANMIPSSAGGGCFSEVDVRCCVFTESTSILKPE